MILISMGNKYHHHHQIISSFNPTCCLRPPLPLRRVSLDEIPDGSTTTTCSSSYSSTRTHRRLTSVVVHDEPTSPKIGCMGQIRRARGAKTASTPTARGHLKQLFKFRLLSKSGRSSMVSPGFMIMSTRRKVGDDTCPAVDVADMDPPLPVVVKRGLDESNQVISLWSRRCRGQALEGLQLQIQKPQQKTP